MSPDTYAIADLIALALAADYYSVFNEMPTDAKGMSTQRLYRSFGLAVHFGWARLLTDRYRDLTEIPAPTHQSPDYQRDCTPDGEGVPKYQTYHTPGTYSYEN